MSAKPRLIKDTIMQLPMPKFPKQIANTARSAARAMMRIVLLSLLALGFTQPASAQVHQYTNTTDSSTGEIDVLSTPCSAPFTRTLSVADSFVVADVNLGILMAHTWIGDVTINLVAPNGTRVKVFDRIGSSNDNFNILLDDQAAASVSLYTGSTAATATTVVPPYANTARPANALSAFYGISSNGNWKLEICDGAAGDAGTFFQADLFLTESTTSANLSLAQSAGSTSPRNGETVTFTLTISNAGTSPSTATGVIVRNLLPAGIRFEGAAGTGTYDPATGNWSVGTLAPGQTATLSITGVVTASAGTALKNVAEIWASSHPDPNSTPANGATGEDDYAAVNLGVPSNTAGSAPMLTCPAGTSLLDWDTLTWAAGARSSTYTVASIGQASFTVTTTETGDPTWPGNPITETGFMTGGRSPAQKNLTLYYDFATRSQEAVFKMTLAKSAPGLQFTIFDVDYAINEFADYVVVTGTRQGVLVNPVLTNGAVNSISGTAAKGEAMATNSTAAGNVTVTFQSEVDTVTIRYGNHLSAPSNPVGQGIGIDDITFCQPASSVTFSKISAVLSDPINGGSSPKAIPGATMRYCIQFNNTGATTLDNVFATDTIPASLTYVPGSIRTGTTCASASTAEDDDNSGPDESDPFGASVAGAVLNASANSLAPGAGLAVEYRGTVK